MITISHIKAARFAIGKRLHGYRLLENHKGVSQTEVNMIKDKYMKCDNNDYFETMRIKKIFSKKENHTEKKLIMTTHNMDTSTMPMTEPRKCEITYMEAHDVGIWSDDAIFVKTRLPKRKNSKVSKYDKIAEEEMEAQLERRYNKPTYVPRWHRILAFGLYDTLGGRPVEKRPNFFKVLYKNLTNKA